jgi:hypothetical protein
MEIPEELRLEIEHLSPHFLGSVEVTYQNGQPFFIKTIKTKKVFREQDGQHEETPAR